MAFVSSQNFTTFTQSHDICERVSGLQLASSSSLARISWNYYFLKKNKKPPKFTERIAERNNE